MSRCYACDKLLKNVRQVMCQECRDKITNEMNLRTGEYSITCKASDKPVIQCTIHAKNITEAKNAAKSLYPNYEKIDVYPWKYST